MPSVVSKKTQRIFTYLLGTVGIVFIILLLTRQIREGFQTPPEPAATPSVSEFALQRQEECIKNMNDVGSINCQEQTIDGGTVYTCDDEESALEILKCDTLFSQTLDPKHTPFYGLKDSICYRNALSNIYVCYNRPPITVFDDSTKTNEFLNPSYPNMDDPVPGYLAAQYPTICPGYQASYTMLHSGISTLSTNLLLVNTNIGIISSV